VGQIKTGGEGGEGIWRGRVTRRGGLRVLAGVAWSSDVHRYGRMWTREARGGAALGDWKKGEGITVGGGGRLMSGL